MKKLSFFIILIMLIGTFSGILPTYSVGQTEYLPPTVILNSPSDGSISKYPNVEFNCSAIDDDGLVNATLYIGNNDNQHTVYFREDETWIGTTDDSQITADKPDTNKGSATIINVDGKKPHAHAIIKFPNIFGTSDGQIPLGSKIISAALAIESFDAGNDVQAYLLKEDWIESEVTWNNKDSTTSWSNPGADGSTSTDMSYYETFSCTSTGTKNYNITEFVQSWSDSVPNYGIVLLDSGTNGIDFYSSEHSTTTNRPMLTVTYEVAGEWVANQTKPASGLADSVIFNLNLNDDNSYIWNCLFYDNVGNSMFATSNYSLTVDTDYTPKNPPKEPVLKYPEDGATNMPTSPVLNVSVSDQDGGGMDVTFYGRVVGGQSENFTIIVLPDTQNYASSYPDIFTSQTEWIVNQKNNKNIVFVTHEGDIVNSATSNTQWQNANTSMGVLDGNVPYNLVLGNHDHEGGTTTGSTDYYNTYFPVSRFSNEPWWGGSYNDNDNNYQLLTIGGEEFIFLSMDYCPSSDEVQWANDTLKVYSSRKAVLTTHAYLSESTNRDVHNGGSTEYLWADLIRHHTNLQLVLCGHVLGEARRTDNNLGGNPVHQILADYQGRANGGNGWLRIMEFVPAENKIYVKTYSPYLDRYETDTDSEFVLDYLMGGFNEIGTNYGVPSDSSTTIPWNNLSPFTTYEWFVRATDSSSLTNTSQIWVFTTGAEGNQAPVADAGSDQEVIDLDEDGYETVTLDASNSYDLDGTIVSYEWKEEANLIGSEAVINVNLNVGAHSIILTVTDNEEAMDSDIIIVTIKEPPVLPIMHIADITMDGDVSQRGKNKDYYCLVTTKVKVVDKSGAVVKGVTVYGSWSGAYTVSVYGNTGREGIVKFKTGWVKGSGNFNFIVDSLEKGGYAYDPSTNVEISDSIMLP